MSRHHVVRWPVAYVVVLLLTLAAAPATAGRGLAIGKRVRLATEDPPSHSSVADTFRVVHEDSSSATISLGDGPVTWTKNREWLHGELVASDERHFTLRVDGRPQPVVIRRADVIAVDVWDSSRSRGKGALVGAAVGCGLGAIMGFGSGDDSGGFIAFTAEEKALIGAILMTPLCALVGLAVPPHKDWRKVPLDRVRVALGQTRDGRASVSMNVSF